MNANTKNINDAKDKLQMHKNNLAALTMPSDGNISTAIELFGVMCTEVNTIFNIIDHLANILSKNKYGYDKTIANLQEPISYAYVSAKEDTIPFNPTSLPCAYIVETDNITYNQLKSIFKTTKILSEDLVNYKLGVLDKLHVGPNSPVIMLSSETLDPNNPTRKALNDFFTSIYDRINTDGNVDFYQIGGVTLSDLQTNFGTIKTDVDNIALGIMNGTIPPSGQNIPLKNASGELDKILALIPDINESQPKKELLNTQIYALKKVIGDAMNKIPSAPNPDPPQMRYDKLETEIIVIDDEVAKNVTRKDQLSAMGYVMTDLYILQAEISASLIQLVNDINKLLTKIQTNITNIQIALAALIELQNEFVAINKVVNDIARDVVKNIINPQQTIDLNDATTKLNAMIIPPSAGTRQERRQLVDDISALSGTISSTITQIQAAQAPPPPPSGPPSGLPPSGLPPSGPPVVTPPSKPPGGPPSGLPPGGPPSGLPPGGPPVVPPSGPPVVPPSGPPVVPPSGPPVVPPSGPPVVPPPSKPPSGPPVVPPPSKPPGGPPVTPPSKPPVVPPSGPPVIPPSKPPVVPPSGPPVVPPSGPPIVTPPTGPPGAQPIIQPTYNEIQRDVAEVNEEINDINGVKNKIISNISTTQSDKQLIINIAQRLQTIDQKYPPTDPVTDISKNLTNIINSLGSLTIPNVTLQIGGNGTAQFLVIINSLIDITNILLQRINKLATTLSSKPKAPQYIPSVPPTDTTDYTRPLMVLIAYKIGSLNTFDIELIKYCDSIGLDINATLAICIAQNKYDIEQILSYYNKNLYYSSLMNILRYKKLSAEMKFRKDYGIVSDNQINMLLSKQSIW